MLGARGEAGLVGGEVGLEFGHGLIARRLFQGHGLQDHGVERFRHGAAGEMR